ncbi:MAG: hypothetical protein BWY09_00893 [Candidatus Hydrogenedentes bacterium ADurb.Bin179]|nr:MAG: hypothetical protein BWY09_00893 [Candidatus Hydrogenedentes bacterium ADurb.Bin179]
MCHPGAGQVEDNVPVPGFMKGFDHSVKSFGSRLDRDPNGFHSAVFQQCFECACRLFPVQRRQPTFKAFREGGCGHKQPATKGTAGIFYYGFGERRERNIQFNTKVFSCEARRSADFGQCHRRLSPIRRDQCFGAQGQGNVFFFTGTRQQQEAAPVQPGEGLPERGCGKRQFFQAAGTGRFFEKGLIIQGRQNGFGDPQPFKFAHDFFQFFSRMPVSEQVINAVDRFPGIILEHIPGYAVAFKTEAGMGVYDITPAVPFKPV